MGEMDGQHSAGRMGGMAGHAMGPLWPRALRSSTHCMAGCALGDLMALVLVVGTGLFGGTMAAEVVTGAVLAFALGLFVFQALTDHGRASDRLRCGPVDSPSRGRYHHQRLPVGQIAALYLLDRLFPGTMGLTAAAFVIMQAAMAAGFLTTYPTNYGLVASGIKAGM